MQESSTTSSGSALVATFPTHEAAHSAATRLHAEGFHRTWIGITRGMEEAYSPAANAGSGVRVESDNALARFFGTGDESLHDALVHHGVSETDAARIDGTLPADSAVLTVEGSNHPELAAQIVSEAGGFMVGSSGASSLYDHYADETDRSNLSRERLSTLGDYSKGEKLDEPRRLQLREERLSVDKHREKTGEATIGKNVVTTTSEVDVPVMHEELYIERRPASGAYADAGTIGDGETIRVPLEREVVDARKTTVVTEEVAVGQRRVEGVEHVSETLRKEELDVDQTGTTGTTGTTGVGTGSSLGSGTTSSLASDTGTGLGSGTGTGLGSGTNRSL